MAASNLANQTMRSLLDQIYTHACSEQKKNTPGETTVSIEVIFSDETRVTYTGLYPSREVIYLTAVSTDSMLLGDVNTVIQAENIPKKHP